VILPEAVHTTKTYVDVLDAMEAHGLKATKPVVGDKYSLGPASFIIVSPNSSDYDELNNYSVGIRLTYNHISFLLAGDAEKLSEEEMLKNGLNLCADVLKLSHHGSGYSSCEDFLDAVNPDYAVICVGKDNEYGHPDPKTLRALVKHKIKVYRTDAQQTVIFTTDGKTISTNKEPYVVTENDLKADTN
jgi:competence protein ComEC